MSVVVAVKEDGIIYMGADTQATGGMSKTNKLHEPEYKLIKFENGIIVGFCGRIASVQQLIYRDDIFTLDENNQLTKSHIVKNIVSKLIKMVDKIGNDDRLNISLLIAHKDKLYQINNSFNVISLNEYGRIGAGQDFLFYNLCNKDIKDPEERILKALINSARLCESVGGPYVLINTRDLEFKMIDMGGENY